MERWGVDQGKPGIVGDARGLFGLNGSAAIGVSNECRACHPANRLLIVKDGLALNTMEKITHLGALGGYEILVASGGEDIPSWLRKIDPTVLFLDHSGAPGEAAQFLLYLPFDYRLGVVEHDGRRELIDNFSQPRRQAANFGTADHPPEPATPEYWLAQFSHELRTPLNSILGFSDVLLAEFFGDIANDKQKEYIENVRLSGQYLLDLINDILDYSAFEAGKLELNRDEIDVETTLRECVRHFSERADQAEIDLSTDIADHLPTLFADSRRIKQILFNLISNAIKFTPPGEVVIVGARTRSIWDLDIFVSDTGIGMDEDGLKTARRKFGQVAGAGGGGHAGTGLGLPIAVALTEAQGGSLEIESAPGAGTTAHVCFSKFYPKLA
jgi:signal transduction histidine kinase